MKPEAVDAMTTRTVRPTALDAATTQNPRDELRPEKDGKASGAESPGSTTPSRSAEEKPRASPSVGHVVDGVVNGVKAAIDGVLTWAEDKVEELGAEPEDTGPYSSPALCAPSDLDPIASGVLPAMPSAENAVERSENQGQGSEVERDVKKHDGT